MLGVKQGYSYLSENDQKLAPLVHDYSSAIKFDRNPGFVSLVRIIVGQQLSGQAAKTIFDRLCERCGTQNPSPDALTSIDPVHIREVGISRAKTDFIVGLAQLVLENSQFFSEVSSATDDEALGKLTAIRGVGIWTANIYLMFSERRLDLYPFGDSSLERAIKLLYGINAQDEDTQFNNLLDRWKPYRSLACMILWRWLDDGFPETGRIRGKSK